MEETLKAIQQQLMSMAAVNEAIVTRLDTLEETHVKPETSSDNKELGSGEDAGIGTKFLTGGKEKSLSLTFGDG